MLHYIWKQEFIFLYGSFVPKGFKLAYKNI